MTATEFAIVAFPVLKEEDSAWIEAVRSRHDPQYGRIRAHFTFVFPRATSLEKIRRAAAAAVSSGPIPFVSREAIAVRRDRGGGLVFLIPDEAGEELIGLHERLSEELPRLDSTGRVQFLPHITLAASSDFLECSRLARELNSEHRRIRGTVVAVEVLDVGAPLVRSLSTHPL